MVGRPSRLARRLISSANATNDVLISPGVIRDITAEEGWSGDSVGDEVCNTGIATGYDCGVLKNKTADKDVEDPFTGQKVTLRYQRFADYTSNIGDSGTAILLGGLAKGIHMGGDNFGGYYTHIWDARKITDTHGVKKS